MTNQASSFALPPIKHPSEDGHCAHSTTSTAAHEPVGAGPADSPAQSDDGALKDIHSPGKTLVSRQYALDIAVRAALSQADEWRILALSYPTEYRVFWQVLADIGMTQERLMDRMGASP